MEAKWSYILNHDNLRSYFVKSFRNLGLNKRRSLWHAALVIQMRRRDDQSAVANFIAIVANNERLLRREVGDPAPILLFPIHLLGGVATMHSFELTGYPQR